MSTARFNLDTLRATLPFQSAALAITVMAATAALAVAFQLTRGPIAAAQSADINRSLAQVLPEGSDDNDIGTDIVKAQAAGRPVIVHVARKAGAATGVVLELADYGYGGEIDLVMGVDPAGRVTGVRITRHTETPGLGDKIDRSKADWVDDFNGRSLGDPPAARWAVKKDGGDFDQFAGATITPRAVLRAVKAGLELFAAKHDEWLAAIPAPAGKVNGEQHG
jgi:electron transport complex protein RnfG